MKKVVVVIMFALSAIILMSGCSGSGGNSTPVSATLSGTAATGAPIDGTVTVKDANGAEVSIGTGTNGSFTLDVAGMTPPYLLKIMPADGTRTLYSFSPQNGQTVNLTPTTNLAMFLASGKTDLDAMYAAWNGMAVSEEQVAIAGDIVRENLKTQLTNAGIDTASFDVFTTSFSADSTGYDAVLDTLDISIDATAGSIDITESGSTLAFDENMVSTDGAILIVGADGLSTQALAGVWTTECYSGDGGSGPDIQETLTFYKATVSYTNKNYTSGSGCDGGGGTTVSSYSATIASLSPNRAVGEWIDGMGDGAPVPMALDNATSLAAAPFTSLAFTLTAVNMEDGGPAVGATIEFAYVIDNTDPMAGMYLYRVNLDNSPASGEVFDNFSQGID